MNQYKNEFDQATKNYQNVLNNLASGLFGDKQQAPPAEVLSFGTSWLYAAYKTKARHVAAIPHIITKGRGKKPVELDIDMDLRDLVERVHMSTFSIYGYSYLLKLKGESGRLLGIRWLDPTQVSYDLDHKKNQLLGFRYNGLFYPVDKRGNCDIVYFWLPTLRDIGPGLPTSSVLEHSATALRYSTIMLSLFYQQGGMPLTIVPLPNGVGREEGERIEGRLQRLAAGVRNAFRFVVLNREIVPQRLGANPNELDYSPSRKELLAEICAVTGVPQFILTGENTGGLGSDSTAHQARLLFTQNIVTEAEWIANTLNKQLFDGLGYTFTLEPNKLEIVQEAQLLQVQAVNTAVGQPVMTVDEGREFLGLPPLPKQEMESAQEELPQEEEDDTPEDDPAAEERKTLRNWIAKRIKKGQPLDGFIPAYLSAEEVQEEIKKKSVDKTTRLTLAGLKERERLENKYTPLIEANLQYAAKNLVKTVGDADKLDERFRIAFEPLRLTLRNMMLESLTAGVNNGRAWVESEVMGVSKEFGVDWDTANQAAIDWLLGDNGFLETLFDELGQSTINQIKQTIVEWINNKETILELAQTLANNYGFSSSRAEAIAVTEVTRAYARGNIESWRASGLVQSMQWRTANDERVCPICAPLGGLEFGETETIPGNINQQLDNGVTTPLGTPFTHPGGNNAAASYAGQAYDSPPAHPRCRCSVVPIIG